MRAGLFITGTGTGVGKTWVTRGLARALARRGDPVAALKPIETGCNPTPMDAVALARACGRPALADLDGLYRAAPPLAPRAIELAGDPAPDADALAHTVLRAGPAEGLLLVEGAGGLLVPLDGERTIADLARALGLPLLLVARDALGVLSHTLTAWESAQRRGLEVAAVTLTRVADDEPSAATNQRILEERLGCPVLGFPRCDDDDDVLADAADGAGLVDLLDHG